MKVEPAAATRRWPGAIPIRHRYTPGVVGVTFFEALRDRGMFLGSRCAPCGRTYVPARMFCERCFGELSADTQVGPGGQLVSVTVGHVDANGDPLDEPVVLGLVRLDGADSCLLHFLILFGDGPPPIGAHVEAIFRPREERSGSILDVQGFTPDGSHGE